MAAVRNQKDLGAGLLYIAFGAVGFWMARDYGMGQASRMGAGYFPTVLSALLMAFGVAAVIRAFITKHEEQVGAFAWKATAMVCGSTVLFSLALMPLGLIIALVILCLVAAAGSHYFKFDLK